jgi:two-component system LytT family response regulator
MEKFINALTSLLMADFFFVNNRKRYSKILFTDIQYIEALKKYIKIFTTREFHVVSVTMSYAEQKLPNQIFCRIHKSYIISLGHLRYFNNEFVSLGDKILPIGQHYKGILHKRIDVWGRDPKCELIASKNIL